MITLGNSRLVLSLNDVENVTNWGPLLIPVVNGAFGCGNSLKVDGLPGQVATNVKDSVSSVVKRDGQENEASPRVPDVPKENIYPRQKGKRPFVKSHQLFDAVVSATGLCAAGIGYRPSSPAAHV